MKILITGATGLIGQELVALCHEQNFSVNFLTTNRKKISHSDAYQGFYWNPKTGEIDKNCFKNVSAIINLVGASVSKRWSKSYKKEIIESRVKSAELILNSLKEQSHHVRHIVSASAIGIYEDSLTNYYDEDSSFLNDQYLGKVVTLWEEAIDQFRSLNILVSKVRIGLVLSNKGGALTEIVKPIKLGVGAAFGSGNQWQSWIHVNDLARLFLFVLTNKSEGVFNGVAPNAVTNSDFTKTAAAVLKRPLFLPNIPRFVMRSLLGEMHVLLFSSQRVSSKKIENRGFDFKFLHLETALKDLLKKRVTN